ncbi:hypothetical protein G7Y89_g7064 [Cudoniella acicularis]|uniref:Peptidase A1 domain-containing protein n=1 Tax=Cudoniella acicularis TaxID=354080 RepID=A0A8H4RLV8_9HELO|nr:hypothetical protein G7Y89_g7064 [Cudoniella acicularis]
MAHQDGYSHFYSKYSLILVIFFLSWASPTSSYAQVWKEEVQRSTATTIPQPLVIPPSQHFEGIDGLWSTFNLQVGTPEQDVRVLVSTASPQTMVVSSNYGCSNKVIANPPLTCAEQRGQLFDASSSSTWIEQGNFSIDGDGVGFERNLGYQLDCSWGLDTVHLSLVGGPTLPNQTIASFFDARYFYLGVFGLGIQPVNYTILGNSSAPTFFTSLKNRNLIPSLSWSYTAGAHYQLKQVFGQLIFGGYDAARIEPNTVSFDMAPDSDRDLVVWIQEIDFIGTTQKTILPAPIDAFIDSTDPLIWLPESVCKDFEIAFNLTLDNRTNLYLLNNSQHAALRAASPSVSFRLSNSQTGGQTVTITLPYPALDLTVEYPIVPNSTYYFPIRRAANSTQYTLGRTFLQEAYLTTDYENNSFTVSQCSWTENTLTQNIITIPSHEASITNSTSSSNTTSSINNKIKPPPSLRKSISKGAIAGIVVAVVILLAISIILAYLLFYRRKRDKVKEVTEIINNTNNSRPKSCYSESVEKVVNGVTELSSHRDRIHEVSSDGNLRGTAVELDAQGRATAAERQISRHASNRSELESPNRALYRIIHRQASNISELESLAGPLSRTPLVESPSRSDLQSLPGCLRRSIPRKPVNRSETISPLERPMMEQSLSGSVIDSAIDRSETSFLEFESPVLGHATLSEVGSLENFRETFLDSVSQVRYNNKKAKAAEVQEILDEYLSEDGEELELEEAEEEAGVKKMNPD